jgi:hypothetical protein
MVVVLARTVRLSHFGEQLVIAQRRPHETVEVGAKVATEVALIKPSAPRGHVRTPARLR